MRQASPLHFGYHGYFIQNTWATLAVAHVFCGHEMQLRQFLDNSQALISHLILEDPAHSFGSGDPEERAANYTRDIGRPVEALRAEITASNPGWTGADIEGKIDALHKVSREAVVSVFSEAGQMGEAAWEQARRLLPAGRRAVQIGGATHNVHRGTFNAFMQAVNDFLLL
jgi:hypothetical protein